MLELFKEKGTPHLGVDMPQMRASTIKQAARNNQASFPRSTGGRAGNSWRTSTEFVLASALSSPRVLARGWSSIVDDSMTISDEVNR